MEATMEAAPEVTSPVTPPVERVMVLGGRTFRQSTVTTIDRDAYLSKRFRVSGLAAFSRTFDPATDDLNEFSEKLLWEAFESGVLYEILAGMLIQDGVRWTRKVAETNAAFFANLTDAADKHAIAERSGDILFDFLVLAAASRKTFPSTSETSETSQDSSGQTQPTQQTQQTRKRQTTRTATPSAALVSSEHP
jgi:hypothetical protein